jgi:hypothetical protein
MNMEGDGFPGFVAVNNGNGQQAGLCLIRVVKEPVHNQLVCVCTLNLQCGDASGYTVAGDFDGDGRDEFAVETGDDVHVFKYTAAGRYEQVWHLGWPGIVVQAFDLNHDGRDQLLITADSTYIYEDTNGLGVAEFTRLPERTTVKIQPSVARLGSSMLISGLPPGADIEVHSLDGRLVNRASGVRQSIWTWNLRNQSGNLVPAGTYFAVIRCRGKSTSLKLCIVK